MTLLQFLFMGFTRVANAATKDVLKNPDLNLEFEQLVCTLL